MDALAHVLIRRGGDGTGVQNHKVGVRRARGALEPALLEHPLQGGAVSLRGAAAEVVDEEAPH